MTVLVLIEHDRGEAPEAAWEGLTAGRRLAESLGAGLEAVVAGESGAALADKIADYGADVIHVAEHELLADYGPDAWAETLRQLLADVEPTAVVGVGTDRGNEVLAQLAARLDLPFVANCLDVQPGDDPDDADEPWALTRVQWGGSLLEDASVVAELKLFTYAHHGVVAEPADNPGAGAVETFEPTLGDAEAVTIIRDRAVESQGVTLSTAPVVVSGGRGVGSADGFAALEELAELLGGRVGCSRAVTNNGWRPHRDQVGQTGTRIAPEIYIATGISGAIQHWVGAMASKKILAINTDPEANMVVKADYAVIADLHEVVPAISAEIRRRRGS
ncbi:MAG: electron transfer flavoprotein subunit alpha/FixB family protein [Actinomycetota bacterium]